MGKQNFHNSTLQLASLYSRIPLLVVRALSVHAGRGLICTRGPGPRLYTRNGFAVCMYHIVPLCSYSRVFMYASPSYPPHPSQQICSLPVVCMQVQGMLSSHPPHPSHPSQLIRRPECVLAQGTLSSHPPQPLHPAHPMVSLHEKLPKGVC